ncbi:hypothetical protein DERP_000449 [Dermatophagoides pteronyssinus]|uniref:Uncharacterized protein n=1 Tax=Dermatophagoides pteronyssinus TaxID=6956 RepID=A0ABQ8J066_DERPT|nr:hypothetical protein DERP_000449 [Dermatophagoides pteronyssinus]
MNIRIIPFGVRVMKMLWHIWPSSRQKSTIRITSFIITPIDSSLSSTISKTIAGTIKLSIVSGVRRLPGPRPSKSLATKRYLLGDISLVGKLSGSVE